MVTNGFLHREVCARLPQRIALFAVCTIVFFSFRLDAVRAETNSLPPGLDAFVRHAVALGNDDRPFTFQPKVYQNVQRDWPIGVFDSGIGGLTVLQEILALDAFDNDTLVPKPDGRPDFAGERFIYLGDQANMPYGNYAAAGKEDYLKELILKDSAFLLGDRYRNPQHSNHALHSKPPVKAIVIACNTATAYGLNEIRQALATWNVPIPVIGVVEAGARGVNELIASRDSDRAVGVLATVGTCSSLAYPKAIAAATGIAGKRLPTIIQHGSVGLAGAIEGDPRAVAENIEKDVLAMVTQYQPSGTQRPIDTVVLGCTHFPLVESEIRDALLRLRTKEVQGEFPYQSRIAESIQFVNPAELTAKELFRTLARSKLRTNASLENPDACRLFISIPNPQATGIELDSQGGFTYEYKYGRSIGRFEQEDTFYVPMTIELLPESSLKLIEQRLSYVWKSFSSAKP